jgi:hypothetical protein
MSKAALTIPMPESCDDCILNTYEFFKAGLCTVCDIYRNGRHPDCPLVIEGEGLRWILTGFTDYPYICPSCKTGNKGKLVRRCVDESCPSCGVKLAPPLEGEDAV